MRRRTFDLMASVAGLVLTAVLVIGGALSLWAYNYVGNQVHNQLAQQQIFFPPKAAFAHPQAGSEITPSMIPSVSQYAGQQLLSGKQAEVFADDFIAVHLYNMPYHGVYAKISTAARAATPGSAQATSLASLEQTSFQGTMLRGSLLEAYAFGTMGSIAGWASVLLFAGAGVFLVLSGLGFAHARRVDPQVELLSGKDGKDKESPTTLSQAV